MSITIFDHIVLMIPVLSLLIGLVKLIIASMPDTPRRSHNAPSQIKIDAQANSLIYRLFS